MNCPKQSAAVETLVVGDSYAEELCSHLSPLLAHAGSDCHGMTEAFTGLADDERIMIKLCVAPLVVAS